MSEDRPELAETLRFVAVWDSTGREWQSDNTTVATPEIEETIADLFDDSGELMVFAMQVSGVKHYFNPRHIVVAAIKEGKRPGPIGDRDA